MSDWKQSAAKRRDERQTRTEEPRPRGVRKKGRKLWCKGREGIQHQPVCRDYAETKGARVLSSGVQLYKGWKILICLECGKELDIYTTGWGDKPNPLPEWAK